MKVALIGGHLAPALAVMDSLDPSDEVVFFGRASAFEGDQGTSLESRLMQERKIPFVPITTARLQRRITKHTLPTFFKLPVGYTQALQALRRYQPDVVLSFGGYLSLPVCLAAKTLRIPVVIHEQTLQAGVANKIVGKFADRICISWESSRPFFPPTKTVLTGNPLRAFQPATRNPQTTKNAAFPLLYVTGGSAGSHVMNELVEGALVELLHTTRIIHQTGDAQEFAYFDRLQAKKTALPHELQERYEVHKFIAPDRTGSLMQEASLVIGRSGMNTVTELLYFGTPAILIPLPYGQKNEQLNNARFLQKLGLAEIVEQHQATPSSLSQTVFSMLSQLERYRSHAKEGRALIHEDAAEQIIKQLSYVVTKTSS
jgi:UDP-N-acetylglucosamine--N-acetylmuramyl-(pentapeptide) pyrophosphoryl-undecaprenol N-acetylglucosamine transferase